MTEKEAVEIAKPIVKQVVDALSKWVIGND